MTELVWINGDVLPLSEARVGVEDRGFQFADGVYEVIRLYDGRPFTLDEHLRRLKRSAEAVQVAVPMELPALAAEVRKLIARTGVGEGMVYMQLTRGVCARNHLFPQPACRPTLLFYTRPLPPLPAPGAAEGVKLLSVPDERWRKCWIKSIALLPNVLAKNAAAAKGADEAVFVNDDGTVSECSASNLFAVINGKLVTHPAGPKVLPGITRDVLLALAPGVGVAVEERAMTESEALAADELFITSTTREISWVARWNDQPVAPGRCGPITLRLHQALRQRVAEAIRAAAA
jgi:D-alanine transaminase